MVKAKNDLKLDISDSDISLKLSTWLDISVEPPCVTYENSHCWIAFIKPSTDPENKSEIPLKRSKPKPKLRFSEILKFDN